jgi:hypothetical protein
MTTRKRIALMLLWALSLIIVGVFAHAQTPAQSKADTRILSGNDIGFRVERPGKDVVGGTWMARINGEWIPTEPVERVKSVK